MTWTKAISANEVTDTQRQTVEINGEKVLVFRHDDEIHAVQHSCPHLKLPLTKGEITKDNAIICPWHKSAFDITSGDVKDWSPWPPVVGKLLGCLSKKKALKVYSTKVEEGQIWVDI